MPLGAEHPAAWHQFCLVHSAGMGAPAQVAMLFGSVIKHLPEDMAARHVDGLAPGSCGMADKWFCSSARLPGAWGPG